MASNFDFSTGTAYPSTLDRVQRGEQIHDDLPRRRYHVFRDKPGKKGSSHTSPENIMASDEDGTEEHRLDLRV